MKTKFEYHEYYRFEIKTHGEGAYYSRYRDLAIHHILRMGFAYVETGKTKLTHKIHPKFEVSPGVYYQFA